MHLTKPDKLAWQAMSEEERQAWLAGARWGMTRYAHWKDGVQYLGTCGWRLKTELARLELELKAMDKREGLPK